MTSQTAVDAAFDPTIRAVLDAGERGELEFARLLVEATILIALPVSNARWRCLAEALAVASSDAALRP